MKSKLATISISLFLIVMVSSCAKDEGPFVPVDNNNNNNNPNPTDSIPEPTVYGYSISFQNDIRPIFTGSCVHGCHNPNHEFLDLRPPVAYSQLLTDGANAPYVDTTTPKASNLYLHLTGVYTLMPKDGEKLSQGKIDTIYTWISQGALNN